MRIRLIAVGTRMSAWVDAAVADYSRRLRGAAALELVEVPMARRTGGTDAPRAVATEGERILALLAAREHVVALDERGRSFTTVQLSEWLGLRRQAGEPLSFIIGGPDGPEAAGAAPPPLRPSPSSGPASRAPLGVPLAQRC